MSIKARRSMAARQSGSCAMARPLMADQEQNRVRDRIDTGPRFSEADAVRLNRLFHGNDTHEMLASVLGSGLVGYVAVVSSFGAESAVMLHLEVSVAPVVPVLFFES